MSVSPLPVIVGFGGYNAAGRSSFHHAYRRCLLDSLATKEREQTLLSLGALMGLVQRVDDRLALDCQTGETLATSEVLARYQGVIEAGTLIRRVEPSHFDADHVAAIAEVDVTLEQPAEFSISTKSLPNPIPNNWELIEQTGSQSRVRVVGQMAFKSETFRKLEVQAAGILPTGFDPAAQYNSRFHPRSLQLAVLGASDALNTMGIDWEEVMRAVSPDEVAVYAASALGQTDEYGLGGYLQARLRSSRASSKQMALALNSMPADFINAYVVGSTGTTGAMAGACATFLYNLRLAVDDIAAGRHRVVIVGSAEANVNPEVIEGFAAMSALATDERLAKLDGVDSPDYRRASRPFADNCGFTLGESSQYFVLMDDALAVELGAEIYGSVPNVFVNADGFKKSISSPGAGNYVTLAKAVADTAALVGKETIQTKSFVQAHGSSTPQNRITESIILDKVAQAFDIKKWPVTAVKAFVGHPLGPASGDQLSNTLGCFADGWLPGIKTASQPAQDVVDERLDILYQDAEKPMDVGFLNSKGFGGNNATASVLSPTLTHSLLEKRFSAQALNNYQQKREQTRAKSAEYDLAALSGDLRVHYHFGTGIIEDHQIEITSDSLTIDTFVNKVSLNAESRFSDLAK